MIIGIAAAVEVEHGGGAHSEHARRHVGPLDGAPESPSHAPLLSLTNSASAIGAP